MATSAFSARFVTVAPKKSEWLQWLELDLLELDDCEIECNGLSWSISYLLTQAGIQHECMFGYALEELTNRAVAPHYWIQLDGGWIIDFRLRMWLGDKDSIPHGVFHESDASWLGIVYSGESISKTGVEFTREFAMNLTDGKVSHVKLMSPALEKDNKYESLTC